MIVPILVIFHVIQVHVLLVRLWLLCASVFVEIRLIKVDAVNHFKHLLVVTYASGSSLVDYISAMRYAMKMIVINVK
jgi:hypothetical protein